MTRANRAEVRQFVLDLISNHERDVAKLTAKRFGFSHQSALAHINALVKEGIVTAQGKTRARTYELKAIEYGCFTLDVNKKLEEHAIWELAIVPLLGDVPKVAREICAYGFMEMLNNVIDHSMSSKVQISCQVDAHLVRIRIEDFGVGIFKKIKEALGLVDERESILELSKGKFTTDPDRHSGEGIFFTSRIVDWFSMQAGNLCLIHKPDERDWLLETDRETEVGTIITLEVKRSNSRHPKEIYDQFSASGDDLTFAKTHVPLRLAQFGSDSLISRSQARRVLSRFERFSEVFLDFQAVDFIGQAFADEIFRVFKNANPGTHIIAINTNDTVAKVIERVKANTQ